MALLSAPAPIKQYAADDFSYAANKARDFWKDRQKQATLTATATATPAQPKAATSADFSVLRNVKNPALETQQTSLLKDFEKSKQGNETLFQKYLADAQSEAMRAKGDLEKERATYDNTKFREDLAKARGEQEAAIRAQQQSALDFASGNVERRLLGSTLPTGMSSQLQAAAVDEFSRAVLPYEERLASGRREDLGLLRDLDLRTAPLARRAGSEYLSTLLTPLQARTSLLNSNIGTLAALGDMDRANTFYGLSTPYDASRVPALPIPASGYRLPPVQSYRPPNSDYTPLTRGSDNRDKRQAPKKNAWELYKDWTGYYPNDKRHQFDRDMYEMLGGEVRDPAVSSQPPISGYPDDRQSFNPAGGFTAPNAVEAGGTLSDYSKYADAGMSYADYLAELAGGRIQ